MSPEALGPEDYQHLIVADTHPLDEMKGWDEMLRRDVGDHALCGWELPGKHFSRRIMGEERVGQQEPDEICSGCVDVMLEYDLQPERLCLVPSESWDGWEEER